MSSNHQPDRHGTLRDARTNYELSSHQLSLAQKSSALTATMALGCYYLTTQIDQNHYAGTHFLAALGTTASAVAAFVSIPALINAIWENYQKHREFRAIERDISILERQLQNIKRDNIPSSEHYDL